MNIVFIVEDDANIRELTDYTLSSSGFETKAFENGGAFFDELKSSKPDMVLLDIMLPDMDGMEILRILRSSSDTQKIPVIMLTAKSDRLDKIRGLDSGADDYITKPFDILELISRVKAVLRRSSSREDADEYSYREIHLDNKRRLVCVGENKIPLTYKEYELLLMLLRASGTVVSREKIIADIWGDEFEGESRTLDVHIRTLRQKLGKAGSYIHTVRNVGYKVG